MGKGGLSMPRTPELVPHPVRDQPRSLKARVFYVSLVSPALFPLSPRPPCTGSGCNDS